MFPAHYAVQLFYHNNADDANELKPDADSHNRPPSHDGLALFSSRYISTVHNEKSAVQHRGTACVAGHETTQNNVQSTLNKDGRVPEVYRGLRDQSLT